MGRAARAKQARRRAGTADIEVVCPGMLEVLSVGKGDIKLTIDGNDPGEVNDARKIIEEMLSKGYGIFVETDKGLSRVKRFNPKRSTYVISEVVADAETQPVGKRTRERASTRSRSRPARSARPAVRRRSAVLAAAATLVAVSAPPAISTARPARPAPPAASYR